jgi:hypothetical protein
MSRPGRSCAGPGVHNGRVRFTEFWRRMDQHLGATYSRTWAREHVLRELGGRTVLQALDDGEDTKTVWRAVWATLELPASER